MAKKPNILMLTVDALRADRISALGYGRATTPRIDASLSQGSLVCTGTVSNAGFTQASFHSFMTSSRPFDGGGFDQGATTRPRSLFRAFHDGGYQTISLATFPWVTRFFGYGDGAIDRECDLFILNTIVGIHAGGTMSSDLRGWHTGNISIDEVVKRTAPQILKTFENIEDYCARRLAAGDADVREFPNSPFGNERFDLRAVLGIVVRHRAELPRTRAPTLSATFVACRAPMNGLQRSGDTRAKR
jgi:hypothetical protein